MTIIKECTNKYGTKVIEKYNKNNQLIKKIHYRPNDETIIWFVEEDKNEKGIKLTEYYSDGTIRMISYECDFFK